jgi:hypothetical protein
MKISTRGRKRILANHEKTTRQMFLLVFIAEHTSALKL